MENNNDWSRSWKSSEDPSKQRKFKENAPHHHRKRFLHSHLESSVREKIGTRSVPLRTGDQVEVMRGDFSGEAGRVDDIDTEEGKVYVDGIETESVDESETMVALRPSNLKITRLDLDDEKRLEKYEVTEEEKEEISVEPEEDEKEEETEEDLDAEKEQEEMEEDTGEGEDYIELVQENIPDVKDAVEEKDLPVEEVLEAEKDNKDRKTLVDWLEDRKGGEDGD
ncbi:MAG: 50S ribosomal protein L24 [Candidatus Nanohaloarchaeota archaeon QJJ-7]|nr:50S ribosomal protein L24 [Candidatus Nanohaloarchaeota archaeon QJJ-7]